jgi:DNA repair photolyase
LEMSELVVGASSVISPLCYTVLRLEPYTQCPFNCSYCYARWYRGDATLRLRLHVVDLFEKVARTIRRRGLKPTPFRLSTLVDPFPRDELTFRVSTRILRVALKYEYPLVVNTKSTLLVEDVEIKQLVKTLLDRELAVLQVSISTIDDERAKLTEPRAPPPSLRLRVLRDVGGHLLVVRLSPFIPGYSPTTRSEIEYFMGVLRDIGVKHLIIESLRLEENYLKSLVSTLSIREFGVEDYSLRGVSGSKPVVRVSRDLRAEVYSVYYEYAKKYGLGFATCKEGHFSLHTGDDCCGVYLLRDYVLRPTLWDLYRADYNPLKQALGEKELLDVCRKYSRVCSDSLRDYPRIISKALRYHERRLLKSLKTPEVLRHIAPDFVEE